MIAREHEPAAMTPAIRTQLVEALLDCVAWMDSKCRETALSKHLIEQAREAVEAAEGRKRSCWPAIPHEEAKERGA